MITKTHYFFHFNVSPWPLLISLNLTSSFLCLAIFLKWSSFMNMILSLGLTIFTMFFWWFNYSGEMNLEGKNSIFLENSIKFGMILFISSEVFFFFSFFWSYFHYFLAPSLEIGMQWPPLHHSMFDFMGIPFINTATLLISGVTITISHFYFFENKMSEAMKYLISTVILGLFFTTLQVSEYNSSFFGINDSIFGSNFFMLTGFHGLHVLIGTLFLVSVLLRANILNSNSNGITSFELAAWYWHFVDVVWIFLYFIIYYINNV